MERVERLLQKSQVGPRFKLKRLSDLEDTPTLLDLCRTYVEKFEECKREGWGLYFWGNIGSGKTHSATAVCNELIERYSTEILFVNMSDASNRVRSTFDGTRSEDSALFEDMKKVEMLVIDDIGVEKVTEWLSEQLFLVINYRYENNLPIIVTSNQSLEDLGQLHKPQIASRLDEMCRTVRFTGFDRRHKNRPGFYQ